MTGRASMWDGTEWVSMTGGTEDSGDVNPDDLYLRLDGGNNVPSPNNWLRQVDANALYLGLNSAAVSAAKWTTARTFTFTGDVSGTVNFDGSANKTIPLTVLDNSHNHSAYSLTSHLHSYLLLSGGGLTGKVTTTNSGGNVTHEEALRSIMIKPISVGGSTPAPVGGNGTLMIKYDG